MATNGITPPTNERPNYFAGQYLLEDDFQREQQYHRDRQRWHHHLLHVSGIAEGLKVTKGEGNLVVNVSAGSAIDSQGQQIILRDLQKVDLTKIVIPNNPSIPDGTYTLYIGYSEQKIDQQTQGNEITSRRWQEEPKFQLSSAKLTDFIPLAKLTITNGAVSDKIDNSDRVYSGLRLPTIDGEITLSSKNDGSKSLAELKGSLKITGTLSVTDNVGIGTTSPGEKLDVSGNIKATGSITTSSLRVIKSASDFADISFSGSGMGQLQIIGWSSGWNINTITPSKHLYLNRDSDATSNVYIGRKDKELFVRGSDCSVGIGTTNPTEKLEISGGNLKVGGNISATNATLTGNLGIGATSPSAKLTIQTPNDYNGDTIKFESKKEPSLYYLNLNTNVTGGVVRWVFDQKNNTTTHPNVLAFDRGNIGIGTATPGAKLQVQIDGATTAASLKLEHNGSNFIVRPLSAGGTSSVIENTGGGSLIVNPNGGKVGIGTTTPAGTLDVQGNVYIGTGQNDSKNYKLAIRGPNQPGGPGSFQDISYEFAIAGSAKIRAYRGTGWDTYLQFLTNQFNIGKDEPQVSLHINHDGNVGIGTTTPSEKLEISGGNLKVSGNISATNARLTGNVGIGATPGMTDYLDVNSKIGTNASLVVASKTPNLVEKLVNQTKTSELAPPESVLTLVRDGVSSASWSNIVDFRIGRYEKSDNASRTQLDILLAHRDLEEKKEDTKLQRVMTLRSNGYVGIGMASFTKNYTIDLTGSKDDSSPAGNTSLKVDNVSMNMPTKRGLNTVILHPDGTFKNNQNDDNFGDPNQWDTWAAWVNANARDGDIVAVGSRGINAAVQPGADGTKLLSSIGAVKAFDARPNKGQQYVLLFIKGRIGAREELHDRGPNASISTTYESLLEFTSSPTTKLNVSGNLNVNGLITTQKLQLGGKFLLSEERFSNSNDEWLSLRNLAKPQEISGGFAANKFWSFKGNAEISDVLMKKDIRNLSKVLDKVLSLRGVSFQWKDSQPETLPRLGMIAQEVETVFPELVEMGPNNMKAINYTGFIAIMIEAIKEQQKQIEKLNLKISK
ncbi:MAG: tail fiber domain-containing protein [Oscillatoriaceae cyanobacterium Prado104]|jgi:hypothetical protein|nr:tail fiber domain-containing protein [Oscillatoriaceae cyanobacterium Prado104]